MSILTWLSRQRYPYDPLISVEVSESRLLRNLEALHALAPKCRMAPVLKSNAYGHGMFEVARILESARDIPFFVVDSHFEALALRSHNVRTPILVVGYTRPATITDSRLRNVSYAISSLKTLQEVCEGGRLAHIHLKIDTGMHRQGILPEEIPAAIDLIHDTTDVALEGVCTHFSSADDPEGSYTEGQIKVWNAAAATLRAAVPGIRYFHAAATDGARFSKEIDANVVRAGIGLYGLSENPLLVGGALSDTGQPLRPLAPLEPALEMKTIISGVKKIKAGQAVGYGNTFKAPKDMTIATIPVGYYEGLDRRLSNKGSVQVGPARIACPLIGRVSMNIATLDVTGVPDADIGMPVTVMSGNMGDPNSIHSMAALCGTISYDIAVGIPGQLKRIIVE